MPGSVDVDVALYIKVLDGNREAARLFCKTYLPKVFGFCFWKLGDQEIAQEAAQEAFAKFFRAVRRNAAIEPASVKAYLYQIARRNCIDYQRQHGKRQTIIVDFEVEDTNPNEVIDDRRQDTPESLVSSEQQKQLFHQKFNQLNENQQDAIYLIHFEGYTYKEAASILDCPAATVKTRVCRGMLKLAELIKKNGRIK